MMISFWLLTGFSYGQLTVKQIADTKRLNRSPVISDTGLAIWESSSGGSDAIDAGSVSAIYLYQQGITNNLSDELGLPYSGHSKAQVDGNIVVWQATYPPNSVSTPSWVLQEVPLGSNDIPETWANYSISYGSAPKNDTFTNAAGEWVTNEVVSGSDEDPNYFPSLQSWKAAGETDAEGNEILPTYDGTSGKPRRTPTGDNEIVRWEKDVGLLRITEDHRNDLGPQVSGNLMAWQKAKGWPFGWEIMAYDLTNRVQLTTNYYYDMGPFVDADKIVWYGWDGNDFEIYLYDHEKNSIQQITDNAWDDVSPTMSEGTVVWEAYPAVEADVFMWKEGQSPIKLSQNVEDDINPRVWKNEVVWQGFDGDDFEIYRYDGEKTIKLTSNDYDDVNPSIRDNLICWMGYEGNWDAEIFYWNGIDIIMISTNDYEDRAPSTAGGRIIWQADDFDKSYIFLAEPE